MANDRQREYVGLIHELGSHLLVGGEHDPRHVERLTWALTRSSPKPFDVAEAAAMSVAMVKEQAAKKHIQIETEFDAKAAECTGDRRAVQQILINLLSNAVKFTPDGGKVCLTSQEEGGYLVLRVSDTGIGISAEDLDRIGQPFFQVQNDYTRTFEGTGLGLSLVRGLVELHAGGLSMESEPGAGTDVIVRLPIAGPGQGKTPGYVPDRSAQRQHGGRRSQKYQLQPVKERHMTRQSARRPKKASALETYAGMAAQRAGAFMSENPALVGGTTAFAVTMFFVASNALWYQPSAHRDAFFETRSLEAYKGAYPAAQAGAAKRSQ